MTTVDRTHYVREKRHIALSRGEALRMTRALKGMTQGELAAASGVSQAAISSIENERIDIGLERAERLARALGVHPAVLAFPNWRGLPPEAAPRVRQVAPRQARPGRDRAASPLAKPSRKARATAV
jgi:transcriptional regulator with XRE-family HTH domain